MRDPQNRHTKTTAESGIEPADSDLPDYQALYRLLTENAREVVSRHSTELTFLYASPAARDILGHPADKLIGQRLDDLAHPDDLAQLVSTFALAADAAEQASTAFRCCTESGEWRWCEISCRGVVDTPGDEVEIQAAIRDISKYKRIEKAIERVAREWRSTFDAAHEAIIMLDGERNILRVNLATLNLFQCEFKELIDLAIDDALYTRLDLSGDPLKIREAFEHGAQSQVDVKLPDRNFFLRCSVYPIILNDGTVSGAVIFLADITTEKLTREKLVATVDEVRELSMHLQKIREHERKSIAQDLHDELGHMLTALKLDASWLLNRVINDAPEHEERGKELLKLLNRTIESSRRIMTSLHPPVLDDLGLDAALDWLVTDFARHNDSEIHVDFDEIPKRLRGEQAITIFRIFQEALTNIRRHADAANITLEWKRMDSEHMLLIRDDGHGFDPNVESVSGSFGLLGISERARSLNGELLVESEPNHGTTLTIRFPDKSLR